MTNDVNPQDCLALILREIDTAESEHAVQRAKFRGEGAVLALFFVSAINDRQAEVWNASIDRHTSERKTTLTGMALRARGVSP